MKICKEHPTKCWNRVFVYKIFDRLQKDLSIDRSAGSDRQQIITTEKNGKLIENLIYLQEDNPGSHILPREYRNKSYFFKMNDKEKKTKTVQTIGDNHYEFRYGKRRTKQATTLADRFRKSLSIKKCVWQNEKDFSFDVPLNSQNSRIYGFSNKDKIEENSLFYLTNRQSKKVGEKVA